MSGGRLNGMSGGRFGGMSGGLMCLISRFGAL